MVAPSAHLSSFSWSLAVAVRFGVHAADEAAQQLQGRPLVVLTFPGSRRNEAIDRFSRDVSDTLLAWMEVPDGLSTMALGRVMAQRIWPIMEANPQAVLVGLGGGSVMDVAKWIRLRPPGSDSAALDILLESSVQPPGWHRHELWLLPTTAGTGSEVTRWSTLWDTESPVVTKRSFDQPYAYADRAYIDPRLTLTCSETVTRDSALDALGHALEVIWNRHRNPISIQLAESAAQRVLQQLPLALCKPTDLAPRAGLALAALEAGIAFSQTRTALAHALSYPLTVAHGVPHGAAVAVWLPLVWRLACGHAADVDASLGRLMGVPATQGPQALKAWFSRIGFGLNLQALGIDDVQHRVQQALAHPRGRNFEGAWTHGAI